MNASVIAIGIALCLSVVAIVINIVFYRLNVKAKQANLDNMSANLDKMQDVLNELENIECLFRNAHNLETTKEALNRLKKLNKSLANREVESNSRTDNRNAKS